MSSACATKPRLPNLSRCLAKLAIAVLKVHNWVPSDNFHYGSYGKSMKIPMLIQYGIQRYIIELNRPLSIAILDCWRVLVKTLVL